uniref:FK506-binding protein n=1 Tax=Chlamydomonas leiostraca TaxID=1034604 RepID=A0A7S0WTS9_9CHLO|mmetsp:Transcript_28091/g.71613  ORF Transcript_28091/g.71613 Transcript_28091/m.71613 type:complete len:387 (+) Transcript_28091:1-1161(+)|eukprot:CAMPEP_0202867576 /NCGR_PEP_ID=MMETSP1391-20130828/9509_1 /ASSEMBLY_ACC=CAM_ASM_000867 /TAXON_ID=1034604 /ORGANISM="Chlamydomonas leiostraca, Strain SAG 11-49" /LENGTH=386 /DNA_ID=CAMNT_0049547629 /DNA_START=1 /DNA_END=1161 /DNA_ORIENTATION=+
MAFWGLVVKPGKDNAYVPPPENHNLHLSQAALPASIKDNTRVSVLAKRGADDEGVIICTLKAGTQDSVPLDLFFDRYAEFHIVGPQTGVEVHLSGYYVPPDELPQGMGDSEDDEDYTGEDEDEDEDDEDGAMVPHGMFPMMDGDDDDDDDEEDEDDDDEDMDDDEDEEGDSEDEEGGVTRRPHVVIEEVKEEEAKPAAKGKQQQQKQDGKKRPAEEAKPAAQPAAKKQAAEAGAGKDKATPGKPAAATPAKPEPKSEAKAAPEAPKSGKKNNVRRWENGFEIEDVAMGPANGKLAKAGKKVAVRYTGRLKNNGKVFDSTKGKATFTFRLGVGEVIKGWDQGVEGMRVGDKRRIVVPPAMGYGSSGVRGAIPPNATLEFDVELVDVK